MRHQLIREISNDESKPVLYPLRGGFLQPKNKILGGDFAGQVEVIGSRVTQFKPGDDVFGYLPSATGRGTFAEYVCASERFITLKPVNLTFEQAAAVPIAAMTALQGLRDKGNIQPGQKVLINGASGGVGTFTVQTAKAFGAEVTAVCSTRNLEMMRSLGAEHVIDYTKEDFTKSGLQYDLILAVNGYHPISDYLRALKPKGPMSLLVVQCFNSSRQGAVRGLPSYRTRRHIPLLWNRMRKIWSLLLTS